MAASFVFLFINQSSKHIKNYISPTLRIPYKKQSNRRRFQWLFVRVEVELRKLQALRPSDLAVERSSASDEVEHGALELAEAKGRAHTKAPAHFGASSPKAALRSKGLETS